MERWGANGSRDETELEQLRSSLCCSEARCFVALPPARRSVEKLVNAQVRGTARNLTVTGATICLSKHACGACWFIPVASAYRPSRAFETQRRPNGA